jgi:lambda family phage portal protein
MMAAGKFSPLARLAAWYLRRRRRAFEAAQPDRLRMAWKLRASHLSADEEIYRDLAALRAHSREQALNVPYARRYYQLLETQVLGAQGLRYQCMARLASGARDMPAAAALEAAWGEWSQACDVGGRWGLAEMLGIYLRGVARDGEMLVRRVRGWDRNRFRYGLQLLEADRLDHTYNRDLPGGNRIRMGIEMDAWAAPVAYHLLVSHPGANGYTWGGRHYQSYAARDIIHGWLPGRAEQSRGVPWSHASMIDLNHIKEYRTSELIAAELGAKRLGFYEQDVDAFEEPPAADEQPAIDETVEAGTYRLLPYGVKFREAITNHPAASFAAFLKSGLRGVAAGVGVSYNRLASDLEGVNFSSLRSGELDDRDAWRLLQSWMVSSLLLPIQRDWLEMSLTVGALPYSIRDFERLAAARFRPRGWSWVSPRDEATANASALMARTTSRQRICRERGEDWEEILEELAEEEAALRSAGLAAMGAPPAAAPADAGDAGDDDDEADEADEDDEGDEGAGQSREGNGNAGDSANERAGYSGRVGPGGGGPAPGGGAEAVGDLGGFAVAAVGSARGRGAGGARAPLAAVSPRAGRSGCD